MPDLNNLKVMIIGAGPAIIGQGSECDEGALEACRALAKAGCRIISIDSNPDAVMMAGDEAIESTHLQPLTVDTLEDIIALEKPDALLPTFGGRSGLHLASQLVHKGVLDQHNVALWGLSTSTLDKVLDRDALNAALSEIDLDTPPIFTLNSLEAVVDKAQQLGFPVVLRCGNPDLIPDGVLVYNQDELVDAATPAANDPDSSFSVEASLLTWQQAELEILRDQAGQTQIVGGVEYIDTATVHPGDAIGISPPQGISDKTLKGLERHAFAIAEHLSIVGSATVRFAHQDGDGSIRVLAVHPRHTRTSALVTRTAGLSIASMASMLAAGSTLSELSQQTAALEKEAQQPQPIGIKWPHWNFEKLDKTHDRLGPQMQAIGQAVGYGCNFKEAIQKAARAATGNDQGLAGAYPMGDIPMNDLLARLGTATSKRIFMIFEALRRGASRQEIEARTHIPAWVLAQFCDLVDTDSKITAHQGGLPSEELLRQAKADGFSNAYLAQRMNLSLESLVQHMSQLNINPGWASLSKSNATRHFSTYTDIKTKEITDRSKRILLIGSGPHGIGQGSECDYGLYMAAQTIQALGYTPILFNCNLTSVSTGPIMSMPCYCEPLSTEELLRVIHKEKPMGVITHYAGELAPGLIDDLRSNKIKLLGTPLESMALVSDRAAFHECMRDIGIPQPMAGLAVDLEEVQTLADKTQFPLSIKPANAEAGKNAELIMDQSMLDGYLEQAQIDSHSPVWIEQYLEYAIEAQAETLCDGNNGHVAAVMEHIELAGVHAGDSACVLPPYSIAPRHLETITSYCLKVAATLKVTGLVNLRYAIYRDTVYLLEADCNASRNLSLVPHTYQLPLTGLATQLMLGSAIEELQLQWESRTQFGVRAAVFPFNVFSAEDPLLGPKMRATGQVLSTANSFGLAYFRALQAATSPLPTQGSVLITVTDEDKPSILEPARIFHEMGFNILATAGTATFLVENGIQCQSVRKLGFGRPNLLDEIKNGGVQMVINTPTGGQGQIDDSLIRRTAIRYRIANITTPASALAAAKGIAAQRS